jgi:FSR family fosmidomycin resistance protein-like MFS transporter
MGSVGAPAAATARPVAARRILFLVSASHATQHMYTGLLPLTYPAVVIAFHISVGTLGLAVGVVGVVGGLSQISAGAVARRLEARWILGGQNILVGVCAAIGAWSPVYPLFASGQGVAQLASSQQHPVGSSIVARAYRDRRGMALSTHNIGGSIGSLLIPLPAAVLISRLGWRPTLLLLAVPLLLVGLVFLLSFPALGKERRLVPDTPRSLFRIPRLSRSQFLDPKVAGFAIVAATVAAGGRGISTLSTYIPLFLRDRVHLSEIAVGAIFNLVLLGAVAGPLLGGRISDRVGRLPVLWAAYGLSIPAVVVFGLSANFPLWSTVVLALAVGLVAYIENPLLQALLSDAVREYAQSSIFGVYFAAAYGVGSLWLILLGWIIQNFGYSAAFGVMAGCYLGAALLLIPCRGALRRPVHA